MVHRSRPGRPIMGETKMNQACKVKMESWMHDMLVVQCRRFGMNLSDGIREGIMCFIRYGPCRKEKGEDVQVRDD